MECVLASSSKIRGEENPENGKSTPNDTMSFSEHEIERLNNELAEANDRATKLNMDLGIMSLNVDRFKLKITKLEKILSQKEKECEKLKTEVVECRRLREANQENHKLVVEDKQECEKMLTCFTECLQDENLHRSFDSNYSAEDFCNKNQTRLVDKLYTAIKYVLQKLVDFKSEHSRKEDVYNKIFTFLKQSLNNAQSVVDGVKSFEDAFCSSSSSALACLAVAEPISHKDKGFFHDNAFPALLQTNEYNTSMESEGRVNGQIRGHENDNAVHNSNGADAEYVNAGHAEKIKSDAHESNPALVSGECSTSIRSKRKCTLKNLASKSPAKKSPTRVTTEFEGEHAQVGGTTKCVCSSRKFSSIQALKNHLAFWKRPKRFKCQVCEMMFPYIGTLKGHMKSAGHDGNLEPSFTGNEENEKNAVAADEERIEDAEKMVEQGSHEEMEGKSLGAGVQVSEEEGRKQDISGNEQLDSLGPGLRREEEMEGIGSDLGGNDEMEIRGTRSKEL